MADPDTRLKNLVKKANDFDVDGKIPAVKYLRSSKEMEKMAFVYASEQENENGFLLYMKLITLLVEKLPKHPQYKLLSPEQKKTIKSRCNLAFTAAEQLKKHVKAQFEKEYANWQDDEAKRKILEKSSTAPDNRVIHPTAPPAPVSEVGEDQGDTGNALEKPIYNIPIGTQVWGPNTTNIRPSNNPPATQHLSKPQQPPPYQQFTSPTNSQNIPPDSSHQTHYTPDVIRSTKPQHLMFRQVSDSLDGNRRVIIPGDLVHRFLQLASRNTQQNLETCGILNGKLSQNMLRVTHLVIPKQSATSDSCTTENEEELFEVQDRFDTITLGWIHTHPSQTAFLSSVDLHTQCSYQQLMPEAIAIVCAPKYNTTGIYRLTLNHGLKFIRSCNQNGFHPHPKEPPLFEDSPLVSTDNNGRIEVVDLR